MRLLLRGVLAFVLCASLVNLPADAAATGNQALGYVLLSQSAQMDGATLSNGTNVYPGNTLATDSGGAVRLQVATDQLFLLPSSTATLESNATTVTASLNSGTAGFDAVRGPSVAIRALDVTLRPRTQEITYAQVTINGPSELLVSCFRGALDLELDGQIYPLAAGHTYRADIESSDQKSTNASKHPARSRRRLVFLIFGGLAAGGIANFAYHELTESPDKP